MPPTFRPDVPHCRDASATQRARPVMFASGERRRSSTAAGGHTCRSFTDRCAPAGGNHALETERSITALIVG
jgi:hypothetical protein